MAGPTPSSLTTAVSLSEGPMDLALVRMRRGQAVLILAIEGHFLLASHQIAPPTPSSLTTAVSPSEDPMDLVFSRMSRGQIILTTGLVKILNSFGQAFIPDA